MRRTRSGRFEPGSAAADPQPGDGHPDQLRPTAEPDRPCLDESRRAVLMCSHGTAIGSVGNDALAVPQRPEEPTLSASRAPRARRRAGSRRAARAPGSSSSSGARTKRRLVTSRCGRVRRSVRELEVAEQEQVDVERARAVAGGVELAAALGLDLLAEVEQRLRLEVGADADGGVEEVGLVEDLADRLGLVGGGDRLDLDPAPPRAARPRRAGGPRGRRRWSRGRGSRSAPAYSVLFVVSRSSVRSWTTSTATSWIASGSGGSGLAARTRTESQP